MTKNVVNMEMAKIQQSSGSKRCPACEAPFDIKYRPFCSARCSQLDLGHWLNEDYRVPIVEYDEISEIDVEEED